LRVYITFRENSNQGAVFDYIRESIKLFIFQSLEGQGAGAQAQESVGANQQVFDFGRLLKLSSHK
jgi:hypothetical protein